MAPPVISNASILSRGDFVDRAKELEIEHGPRPGGAIGGILTFRLLRRFWSRLWTPPVPIAAPAVSRPAPGQLAITFIGHSTVLFTSAKVRLIVDPYLENWLGPWRRARAAAANATAIGDINFVLVSGSEPDRLSHDSLRRLPRTATLIVPPGTRARVAKLGFARVIEWKTARTIEEQGLEIVSIPAGSARPDKATNKAGAICGHAIRLEGRSVFVATECSYVPGFGEAGANHAFDVALLPIGGYRPRGLRTHRLSPLDAVYAFEDLKARRMIPIAFGAFDRGYEPLDEPEAWLRSVCSERNITDNVMILNPGQTCLLR